MPTRADLNRTLLARQLLLERADLTPEQAVERVGGLQTQYAPSAYVGLWSRLRGFHRADLTDALLARRVVQGWVMRCTIHMVSAADHAPLTEAVREQRRRWWLRVRKEAAGLDMEAAAEAVRGHLAGGPLRQAEIVERLTADGFPQVTFQGVQLWVDLVRVPPAGTWERPRAHVYGLAGTWLGHRGPVDRATAEQHLVDRYLRGFGPATPSDVARHAGWTVTETRAVLDRMNLRDSRDPDGGRLVDGRHGTVVDGDTPAPVRFLSTFDAVLLLGHAARARLVPEEHRAKVFSPKLPQSVPTFLVDGRVAGTWRHTDGRVRVTPFAPLPAAVRDDVEAEAEALTAFHADG